MQTFDLWSQVPMLQSRSSFSRELIYFLSIYARIFRWAASHQVLFSFSVLDKNLAFCEILKIFRNPRTVDSNKVVLLLSWDRWLVSSNYGFVLTRASAANGSASVARDEVSCAFLCSF